MRPQEDKTIIKNYLEKVEQKHCELQYFPTECSCPTISKKSLCFFGHQQIDHNISSNHFLARIMLKKIISHYMKFKDIQMVAMLSCVFNERIPQTNNFDKDSDDLNFENVRNPDQTKYLSSSEEDATEALSTSVQPENTQSFKSLSLSLGKRVRSNSETPSQEIVSRISNWVRKTSDT